MYYAHGGSQESPPIEIIRDLEFIVHGNLPEYTVLCRKCHGICDAYISDDYCRMSPPPRI